MQSLSSWATEDRKTLLHFSEFALEPFFQHTQVNDSDCEGWRASTRFSS